MRSNGCFGNRCKFWTIIPGLILVSSLLLAGCAGQAAPKVYRVGILAGSPSLSVAADGFKARMAELGYIEGKNIVYDVRISQSNADEDQQYAEEFVANKVDLIFAFPVGASLAAKAATEGTSIPVVFSISGLEGVNLVNSVREPGGNITGVRSPIVELPVKNFEIMYQLVPDMERIYTAYAANYPAVVPGLEALRKEVKAEGITLVELPVTSLDELKADLKAREAADTIGMDAIIFMPETLVQSPEGFALLNEFSTRHKIPIGGLVPWEVEKGAVYTSGIDMYEMGVLAAPLADKVLQGSPAGTIPVVSPELHLLINYKRAQELGVIVPESLLLQAEKVIRE